MKNIEYLPEAQDHNSPFSVASVTTGTIIGATMAVLVFVGLSRGFESAETVSIPMAWRVGMWCGFAGSTIGIVLGILGVSHPDRRKLLGIIGTGVNGIVFLGVAVLVGLGMLAL